MLNELGSRAPIEFAFFVFLAKVAQTFAIANGEVARAEPNELVVSVRGVAAGHAREVNDGMWIRASRRNVYCANDERL
ncbi:hypothetical protein IWX46DRAFT_601434 [Phyllosticta citricarpa]|uniref:Uncharacterized protein n=1 Tax=Phyllosticta citricarpa TaxID=55181 RepID=A0ABR1MFX0_9PEZI